MEIASRRREQEVWQACDDLWALFGDMTNLTGDAIRERLLALGKSRGSPNEIYKYRKSWTLSRGIESTASSATSALQSDPISRAVQLVHEKLHSEAQEEIDTLRQEFANKLEEKERLLEESKSDTAALFQEMTSLQNEFSRLNTERGQLEEKISVEIEIRKTLEQELDRERRAMLAATEAKERLLQELKNAHADTVVNLDALYKRNEEQWKKRIVDLEESQKKLGYEFSEAINAIKLEKLQQEAKLKNTIEQSLELEDGLALARRKIQEQDLKFKTMLEEILRYKSQSEAMKASLEEYAQELSTLSLERDKLKYDLVKKDVIIARLRALLAHRREHYEPTYQRTIAAVKKHLNSKSREQEMQNPCS